MPQSCLPIQQELALVTRGGRKAFELDHPPVDLSGQHAAVLLADPASGGDPFLHPLLEGRRASF